MAALALILTLPTKVYGQAHPIHAYESDNFIEEFVDFLFPVSGRERRVGFLPLPLWGKKKPTYRIFDWKRYDTQHFTFYTYPEGDATLQQVIRYFEEDYEKNNDLFGVKGRFLKKIPVIFYQSHTDFEQTRIVPGVVPESLGGVTETIAWKRVTFSFEGSKTQLEHVARHEGTHVYQIAARATRLPLWLIEGTAETNSVFWDADAETVIRDAYFNDFFFPIKELWRIRGTWLMYKQGNYITNYIVKTFGQVALKRIYKNARRMSFKKNIKSSLGIGIDELNKQIRQSLHDRFAAEENQKDLAEESSQVGKGTLLATHGDFFLSGQRTRYRHQLFLNVYNRRLGTKRTKLIEDRQLGAESLRAFRSGADLNEEMIVYPIKVARNDALRITQWSYKANKRSIRIERSKEYTWPHLEQIAHPTIIDRDRIAFVGYHNGFTDLYLFQLNNKKLMKITHKGHHIRGLDYSSKRSWLIFSQEGEKTAKPCDYNYDLVAYDLDLNNFIPLTQTEHDELDPKLSPDQQSLIYVTDKDGQFNLGLLDLGTMHNRQLTKMKIAALAPHWGSDGDIYFNGITKFKRQIYRAHLPGYRKPLERKLPKQNGNAYHAKNDSGIYSISPSQNTSPAKHLSIKSLLLEDGKLNIHSKGNYSVDAIGSVGPSLYFAGKRKESEKLQPEPTYFALSQNRLRQIARPLAAADSSYKEVLQRLQAKLAGKTLMESMLSTDGLQMVTRINNILSIDGNQDGKDVSTFHYSVLNDELIELPANRYLSDLRWPVIEVHFLQEGQMLFISERRRGRRIVKHATFYSAKKRQFYKRYENIREYAISADDRYVAIRRKRSGGDRLTLIDSQSDTITPLVTHARMIPAPGMGFTESGALAFIKRAKSQKKQLYHLHYYHPSKQTHLIHSFVLEKRFKILEAAFSDALSIKQLKVALRCRDKQSKLKAERLFEINFAERTVEDRSEEGIYFRHLLYGDNTLLFETKDAFQRTSFAAEAHGKRHRLLHPRHVEANQTGSKIYFETGEALYELDLSKKSLHKLAFSTFGFSLSKNYLVYSTFDGEFYQLFQMDLKSRRARPLTNLKAHAFLPVAHKNQVAFQMKEGDRFKVGEITLDKNRQQLRFIDPENGMAYAPAWVEGELRFEVQQRQELPDEVTTLPGVAKTPPIKVHDKLTKKVRLRQFTAAAAFDGSRFRYLVSAYADNVFSDQDFFLNSIFLADTLTASGGIRDHNSGISYVVNFSDFPDTTTTSLGVQKAFLLDEFQEINIYGEFELQDYAELNAGTPRFIGPDEAGNNFLVTKTGIAYGFDEAVWDRHGPFLGNRFFLKGEAGFDVGNGELANLDANLEARLYTGIAERVGFAHRLTAGISRGNLPTVFLLGGTISFRGVGFDELEGNTYWVFSEELRIPLLDFAGGKLPDPVDRVLGIFLRYFDVRGGIYADIGAVWLEDDPYDTIYSVGYFFNIPTLFGVLVRLNQGFVGEKDLGVWLGYNW